MLHASGDSSIYTHPLCKVDDLCTADTWPTTGQTATPLYKPIGTQLRRWLAFRMMLFIQPKLTRPQFPTGEIEFIAHVSIAMFFRGAA